VLRWQANVTAYVALLRDEYPPFSWEPGEYPLLFDVPRAERQSRFRLFIRWGAIIPSYLAFAFVQIGWFFTTFIAWFAILITGRYPRGLFKFAVGAIRWQQRMYAYAFLLRDEYPPYSINADARPGNEVLSTIVGLPLFATYVAFSVLPLFGVFGGNTTVHATLAPAAISRDHPSGRSGSLRITLLSYDGNASPRDAIATVGYKFVSFDVRAEKDGVFPAMFWPVFLSVNTCNGSVYRINASASAIPLRVFWRGGHKETTAYFEIPRTSTICELSYFAGRGRIKFAFR
jgi:Domain of unknown function (DUF4389)